MKILNNYKNKCNPNNSKLFLIKSECDKSFGNNYTHGGYKCGKDGKWEEKCIATYCDIGYIFDHNKQQCIIDVCSERENNEKENENENEKKDENGNERNSNTFYYSNDPIYLYNLYICLIKYF